MIHTPLTDLFSLWNRRRKLFDRFYAYDEIVSGKIEERKELNKQIRNHNHFIF
jgi:hypothetical protein